MKSARVKNTAKNIARMEDTNEDTMSATRLQSLEALDPTTPVGDQS